MPTKIERDAYAAAHGPTAGDRVRLADTNLFARVERDDNPAESLPLTTRYFVS